MKTSLELDLGSKTFSPCHTRKKRRLCRGTTSPPLLLVLGLDTDLDLDLDLDPADASVASASSWLLHTFTLTLDAIGPGTIKECLPPNPASHRQRQGPDPLGLTTLPVAHLTKKKPKMIVPLSNHSQVSRLLSPLSTMPPSTLSIPGLHHFQQ